MHILHSVIFLDQRNSNYVGHEGVKESHAVGLKSTATAAAHLLLGLELLAEEVGSWT